MNARKIKHILFVVVFLFVLPGTIAKAADVGDVTTFNVDKDFDSGTRSQVQSVLIKSTSSLNFYVEKGWWDTQLSAKKSEILTNLDNLSSEFEKKIYPTLTSVFGFEWKPGVDNDAKITILFHSLKENAGGYFRSADEYVKLQAPDSNEREMLYLPIAQIDNTKLKILLAHEFVHLITFNQKDRIQGVQEDVWLNEARADYSSTLLGYDDTYEGSNLQKRVKDFSEKPTDSLVEWQETKYDYAVSSMVIHYLVDHYSISVLSDSLKLKQVGISSINAVLLRNGAKEDFSHAFTNWTIAVIINNCVGGTKYCYLSQNLKNVKISSTLNFLPLSGNSSLSVTNITKNWAGNWQKIIGGNGDLKLQFSSLTGLNFQVPYILLDANNVATVKSLDLDTQSKGDFTVKDFGTKYTSLIIIPTLQTKLSDFDGLELTYPYTFTVSVTGAVPEEDPVLIQKLLSQIEALKKQIAALQSGGNPTPTPTPNACSQIYNNLSFGMKGDQVMCLQLFLKSQGSNIYPEGYATGYFGSATRSAVIRFQEKYAAEILIPVGVTKGTGYVGALTRQKINLLLST